jgi:hypothetical protein
MTTKARQTEYLGIKVDCENNAETWWGELDATYPELADSLRENDCAVITRGVWSAIACLPGFHDGPTYAPTPIIDCGDKGDAWRDVVCSRHRVFESAE